MSINHWLIQHITDRIYIVIRRRITDRGSDRSLSLLLPNQLPIVPFFRPFTSQFILFILTGLWVLSSDYVGLWADPSSCPCVVRWSVLREGCAV